MKKIVKYVLLTIVIFFLLLCAIDCIRLKFSAHYTKPLITIGEKISKTEEIYYGIGYSIKYYKFPNSFGYGVDFKLFNTFSLWFYEAQ